LISTTIGTPARIARPFMMRSCWISAFSLLCVVTTMPLKWAVLFRSGTGW
jgi:hypothetical protein